MSAPAKPKLSTSLEIIAIDLGQARSFCQAPGAKSKPREAPATLPAVPTPDLTSLDEMATRLERVLAYSPADSTEVTWIEMRRSEVWVGAGRREASEGPAAAGRPQGGRPGGG